MSEPTFQQFEANALAKGYDVVIERKWAADEVVDVHTHPFGVKALVVQGEMWLSFGGITRRFCPGDEFELAAGVAHSERYGPEGATFWAARRFTPQPG
jgi:hypothetical protein